jgi:tRNA dimethylallyltransferase
VGRGGILIEKEEIEKIFINFAIEEQRKPPQELFRKRVIILAGPTCCGKSALAMMLAEKMAGEIVSADSMQVYRGMDIGTAKPSRAEMEAIPHHLVDIRDVTQSFNVVDFYYEARQACQSIISRNRIPIVVGGSGFYLHALLFGPPEGPPSIPEVRKKFEEEWEQLGAEALYSRVAEFDPDYAKTITHHDRQKIVRALEIITLTGKKISQMAWKERKQPVNYDFRCWFLQRPRENLYRRIEKRCDKMLLEGLLEEVTELEQKGIWENSSACQAIGYRQTLDFLKTSQTRDEYRKYVEKFKQASRNYAKRQFTWFRKEPIYHTLDLDLHDPETAVDIIMHDYECWLWEK